MLDAGDTKLLAKALSEAQISFYKVISKAGFDGSFFGFEATGSVLSSEDFSVLGKVTVDTREEPVKKKKEKDFEIEDPDPND